MTQNRGICMIVKKIISVTIVLLFCTTGFMVLTNDSSEGEAMAIELSSNPVKIIGQQKASEDYSTLLS